MPYSSPRPGDPPAKGCEGARWGRTRASTPAPLRYYVDGLAGRETRVVGPVDVASRCPPARRWTVAGMPSKRPPRRRLRQGAPIHQPASLLLDRGRVRTKQWMPTRKRTPHRLRRQLAGIAALSRHPAVWWLIDRLFGS